MSLSHTLVAPPASSVQVLAQQFGAASCGIRFSQHAYSGLVVVVRFGQCSQAYGFARIASRLAGYRCTVRGSVVSVPVAPVSPVQLQPRPAPAPVAVFVQPAPAPGGLCVGYLKSGAPCTRKAKFGHYCARCAKAVM